MLMHAKLDLLGKQVGDWTVVEELGVVKGMRRWRCQCRCGYERDFSTSYLNTGKPSRCPDCRKSLHGTAEQELLSRYVGKTVGKYTVIKLAGRNRYNSRIWLCRCVCGRERTFLTAALSGNGKRKATQCPDCAVLEMELKNRTVTEVPQRFWQRLANQAARRGIEVNLTRTEAQALFEQQRGKCALTGEPLHFTRLRTNYNRYTTASLDRIDSQRPYEMGNVQWVHKVVNGMKSSLSQDAFRVWCCKVAAVYHSERTN